MRADVRGTVLAVVIALLAALVLPAAAADKAATAPAQRIEPVFPVENETIVFVEAEDAVSTNFAREPVLNYGCSGFRALQLNRSTGLEGVGSFYADYVFTVPSEGTWELWYGGTPPGPRDELYPSYSSPLSITVDSQKPPAGHPRDRGRGRVLHPRRSTGTWSPAPRSRQAGTGSASR